MRTLIFASTLSLAVGGALFAGQVQALPLLQRSALRANRTSEPV
jgi:uncharacterized membrane protein YgdD (TMEM256/DUF423 family)